MTLNNKEPQRSRYKVVMIGDSSVGKTCLMQRYANERFAETYVSTIGVDCCSRSVDVDGESVRLDIFDTAGQERFRAITSSYYRRAQGILVVFDVGDRESFEHVMDWFLDVEKHTGGGNNNGDGPSPVKMLVGAKCDVRPEERAVSSQEAMDLAGALNDIPYIETSAKSGINVESTFMALAVLLQQQQQAFSPSKVPESPVRDDSKRTIRIDGGGHSRRGHSRKKGRNQCCS